MFTLMDSRPVRGRAHDISILNLTLMRVRIIAPEPGRGNVSRCEQAPAQQAGAAGAHS